MKKVQEEKATIPKITMEKENILESTNIVKAALKIKAPSSKRVKV